MEIFVTPAPGLKVRDPRDGEHLPDKGKAVTDSPYWRRRIKDGDVTRGETKAAASQEPPEPPATEDPPKSTKKGGK